MNPTQSNPTLSPVISRRRFFRGATATVSAFSFPRALQSFAEGVRTPVPVADGTQWVTTTEAAPWQAAPPRNKEWRWDTLDLTVEEELAGPAIKGFGACFNEFGWTSLEKLSAADRDAILREMFAPGVGAQFTLCRMPIGANDFARSWYSYDEVPGDFSLAHFNIANDRQTIIPFIQGALHHNPQLRLWASPWSPPSWMKVNGHYAEAAQSPGRPPNGIRSDQIGHEGADFFIQQEPYFDAYARYFARFIEAYRQNGIPIAMVMPQNEFNSAQPFPSCTWTPEGLARFIRHLGPAMSAQGVQVFFGTLERDNADLLNRVLADKVAAQWIKGVGVQWAGKRALTTIHREHPALRLYGSEQECGDGSNTWAYAGYCWRLMKHYLESGASAYMYWNLSLETGGVSRWGWPQNSFVTVDAKSRTYCYNHDYFLLKHVSHFVQNGGRRAVTNGTCSDALAFRNPDGSFAVVVRNELQAVRPIDIMVGGKVHSASLQADSINTLFVPGR